MDYDVLAEIREALDQGDDERLRGRAQQMRPADLADIVERLDAEERSRLFALLDDDAAADALHELDEGVAGEILQALPAERASRLLGDMPPDDAADVLQDLPDAAADALLAAMDEEEAQDVRELLEYPETTAGGRMVTEFVTVAETAHVADVIADLRAHPPAAETAYYLYVCGPRGRLVGVVSLRDLIVADPGASVREIMTRDVISVRADADQEEAADLVARYDLLALPVVDEAGRVIGVVTVDDVLEVLEEEATEDILHLSSGAPPAPDGPSPAPSRLPAAVPAVVCGLGAALVLALMRDRVAPAVPFLLFVPLAVTVSEVVTGQVMGAVTGAIRRGSDSPDVRRSVLRELLVTLLVGAAAAGLLFLIGTWQRPGTLARTLGLTVVVVAVVAAVIAALLPAAARALHRDPTAVSVSLAAGLSDVAAVAVYLWIVAIGR